MLYLSRLARDCDNTQLYNLCCLCSGTTVILRDQARLWPGKYKVVMEIKDQQGKSCGDVQVLDLMVCTCIKGAKSCVSRSTSGAVFGASGVLLLLLGLLLLLCEYSGWLLIIWFSHLFLVGALSEND